MPRQMLVCCVVSYFLLLPFEIVLDHDRSEGVGIATRRNHQPCRAVAAVVDLSLRSPSSMMHHEGRMAATAGSPMNRPGVHICRSCTIHTKSYSEILIHFSETRLPPSSKNSLFKEGSACGRSSSPLDSSALFSTTEDQGRCESEQLVCVTKDESRKRWSESEKPLNTDRGSTEHKQRSYLHQFANCQTLH